MKRGSASACAATTLVVCALLALPAHAQMSGFGPAFSKLTGGLIWGSAGFRDPRSPERLDPTDRHPIVRGGLAALYGPFGGQPDTVVTLDSVRTTVEWMPGPPRTPGATRADTVRSVHALRSHYTIPGRDGWVSLAVGYEYSGNYRVDLGGDEGTLASTFPVGAFYAAAYFGPFPVWKASRSLFWYGGLGAGLVQLNDAFGRSDDTLVRFDTERALAPEATMLLGWRVHPGVRVLGGMSAQHIRWSSIRYRAPSEQPLADDVLRRLPDGLRLTSVHLVLGVGFDASDLFSK